MATVPSLNGFPMMGFNTAAAGQLLGTQPLNAPGTTMFAFGGAAPGQAPPNPTGFPMTGFNTSGAGQLLANQGQLNAPAPTSSPFGSPAPSSVPAPVGSGPAPGQASNPLSQMLAQLPPNYQVPDTRWGLPGDRLLRFTPQTGNAGMTFGGGSGGTGGGGNNVSTPGTGAGPGNTYQIPGVGNVQINWGNLASAMAPGAPADMPGGSPAINQAMQKLQPTYTGPTATVDGKLVGAGTGTPLPESYVNAARAAVKAVQETKPVGMPLKSPEMQAWLQRLGKAQQDYIEAQKASGLSPGAPSYLTGPYVTQG